MDQLKTFFQAIDTEMAVPLSTAAEGRVTMRLVSPVPYEDSILIFTGGSSLKYAQLRANPRCCLMAGGFFAEAGAEFCGAAMLPGNAPLRAAYEKKFPGAFDEGVSFGGRNAEFIRLRPRRLSGWTFENGVPTPDGIPTVPFAIDLP